MDSRFLTSKLAIQSSVEDLVGKTSNVPSPEERPAEIPIGRDRNPKVAPGLVRWHDSFEVALAAAKKSGRPIFFFQMLGKLDENFC